MNDQIKKLSLKSCHHSGYMINITIHFIRLAYLVAKINKMKKLELVVENIKCGGCMTSIKKGILELKGVTQVDIALEEEKITIEGNDLDRAAISKKLDQMGYPEKGNNTLFKEAKSYVSCAIGKVSA